MSDSISTEDYGWLLQRELVDGVRGTRCALLASSDGMVRFHRGVGKDDADGLAAMATSQLTIARAVGEAYGNGPGVRQVMSELDDLIFYVSVAGQNGVLAVLAETTVDAGRLTYKMHELARQAPVQLSTPPRAALSDNGSA